MTEIMLGECALADVAGPLQDLLGKLSGLDGKPNLRKFKLFLRGENPFQIPVLTPAIWKQVYDAIGASTSEQALAELMATKNQPNRWIEPVLQVTINQVVAGLRKLGEKYDFKVITYSNDLDVAVLHNDRDPMKQGPYAISFAPNVEADEEFKNLSAEQLKERGHQSDTLLECLLLGMAYIIATEGEHLDDKNVTLCAGSRRSDGSVPSVHWNRDARKVRVDWYFSRNRSDSLRSRLAV